MPNIAAATNYFPKAYENTVPMTITSTVLPGASTVNVTGLTNYTDGDVVCLCVDPGTASLKQVFTGVKVGAAITNVVWTEMPTGGVNVQHAAGATVIDYVTATHWDLFQKGLLTGFNPTGGLLTSAVQAALNISGGAAGGWTPSGFAPTAVTYNGNRSYTCTFAANLTNLFSPGMRAQFTRTVPAGTQSTSLNGSTQFWSKTAPAGMTFTNNFVVSAWVKISSYPPSDGAIISRSDGTNGWFFAITSAGQVYLSGSNAAAGNYRRVVSYQSVPLNKWVHVTAQLDMSTFTMSPTTCYVMIDGVDVPAQGLQGGTNPTALIQAGNLNVGAFNGALIFFPGKIAQAAIFSAKVAQATMQNYISQGLTGTEPSLISAYSFNGNANDLNANANNLTANGAVTALAADSPFGGQAGGAISSTLDYGIVQAVNFSGTTTMVVQVPEGCTIPTSGGVSAVGLSTAKSPYGFPADKTKWCLVTINKQNSAQASPTVNGWYNVGLIQMAAPIGAWKASYEALLSAACVTAGPGNYVVCYATLSTANNSEVDSETRSSTNLTNTTFSMFNVHREKSGSINLAAPATYYLNFMTDNSNTTSVGTRGDVGATIVQFENTYL